MASTSLEQREQLQRKQQQLVKDIEAGIQSFGSFLEKPLKVYESKHRNNHKTIRHKLRQLLQHIRHCLIVLTGNVCSLTYALELFQRQLADNNQLSFQSLEDIQYAFETLLRLHDGHIFNISGECRHAHDRQQQQNSKQYQSRLPRTSTYNPKLLYNGCSWDEWNNQEVGLRVRLVQLLQTILLPPNNKQQQLVWDDYIERCGPARQLESIANEVSVLMDACQSRFTQLKQYHLPTALSRHNNNVTHLQLVWRDKLEQLSFCYSNNNNNKKQTVRLGRYGDAFQVSGPVLLNQLSEWKRVLVPPSVLQQQQKNKKKKKKIIVESDEEESHDDDDTNNSASHKVKEMAPLEPSTTGLHVTIHAPERPTTTSTTSLNKIKQQLGVNVDALEQSHQVLQSEVQQTEVAAAAIDDIEPDIGELRQSLKRQQKVLAHTIVYESQCPDKIWNARELLRELCMRVGDAYLIKVRSSSDGTTTSTTTSQQQQPSRDAQASVRHFQTALRLVQEQTRAMEDGKLLEEDSSFALLRRNLDLLLGQARVNTGIALVEAAKVVHSREARKDHLEMAVTELEAALKIANALQETLEQVVSKFTTNKKDADKTLLDTILVEQLKRLTLRWRGTAEWYQFQREAAYQTFEAAAAVVSFPFATSTTTNVEVVVAALECQTERYHAWTTLADLAYTSLQTSTLQSIREQPSFYDKLYQYVDKALKHAMHVVDVADGDVLTQSELEQYLSEIQTWWEERKQLANQPLTKTNATRPNYSAQPFDTSIAPQRRYTVTAKRRRSQYNLGGSNRSRRRSQTTSRNQGNPSSSAAAPLQPQRQYRKWREDMVVDKATGRLVPKLEYPSLPPQMPPEFAAILAQRRVNHRS